ncbi:MULTISPECIES: C-terminal binding protein [unclassified Chelatococcus]|uniref:C-terminal binding protein n=1 Tax=unclassified Chelatococcus TaxID=2638111 RepID=UPI001BD19379|nr:MULTISPECIES: C-terminal binding protein [unclassified Chelatococcus]MBS7700646.1 C-terminal binding protein [Chelatococcus sp. YT9]MBX3559077.1 C-terminal binding protein [Chelatococcus sp.]
MKALITDTEIRNPDIEIDLLRNAGFEVEVASCRTPADVIDAGRDADALLVQYAPVTADVFDALPSLRAISRYGIGVDSIDLPAAERHGVWVSNVPDYGFDEVPTHALALLFALLRHVPFYDRNIRGGTWDFQATGPINRIADLSLGIVGLGRLGRFAMERARPFFKDVIAYDPFIDDARWPAGVTKASLQEVFAHAHAISLHVPLTRGSRHLINDALLAAVPERGTYLVNTSRGGLIDLDAALRALEDGRLRGLGLDVMPNEPPPMDHPVLHHQRTVVTPHAAWYSEASVIDLRRKYTENIVMWARNGVAPNAVVIGTIAPISTC